MVFFICLGKGPFLARMSCPDLKFHPASKRAYNICIDSLFLSKAIHYQVVTPHRERTIVTHHICVAMVVVPALKEQGIIPW